jgi:hypothetical protein
MARTACKSFLASAAIPELGRRFMLVDNNPEALEVMARRFAGKSDIEWKNFDPKPYQWVSAIADLKNINWCVREQQKTNAFSITLADVLFSGVKKVGATVRSSVDYSYSSVEEAQ